MCSILDQRTAIVDDRLFFCSGNYTFDDDGLPPHAASFIYWLNLSDTFDVTGPLDVALLGSTDLPSESLNGGKYPDPGGFSGTFFYDHTMLYPYAGLIGPEADGTNNALWGFNTSDNSWNFTRVEGGRISFGENSEGVYASDPRTGTSFYTGGWVTSFNGMYNGTVKFRSSNTDSLSWSFETALAGLQGPNILKGSMVYVRKGGAGILIAFGGYQTAYAGSQIPDWPWDQRPFSEIFIYDIQSSTWYHQTATGDLPELRTEFCAAVSAAPDDSSFQITMHGGWDQLNRRAFNDVYVLSVPSFRWIKIEDSDNPDLIGTDKPGRNRHKCDMWNETSMIVSGGQITLGEWETFLLIDMCKPEYPPIKVLDTSTYQWQTEFNPSLTYSVPGVVTDVIGGDSLGGASLTEPELGWETEDLADIFSQTVDRDTYVPPRRSSQKDPTNSDPDDSGPDDSDPDPSDPNEDQPDNDQNQKGSSSLATGAIAGIAVGAAAALAGVFAAVFLCYRKRRKYQAADQTTPSVSSVTDIPLVKGWHKPELDATAAQRFELGTENYVYEMHGDDIGKQRGGSTPPTTTH
ncbi:hypothetical protein EKO27_g719 [Xylaria grammica]|uniref:Kelch repeat protein n=1 Tax=Xylaria grammica TaxID=363999 RepID=A0A439DIW4_9PEZI|nr:hypothetical protein EKO27_g719 [Xylaria grammica]